MSPLDYTRKAVNPFPRNSGAARAFDAECAGAEAGIAGGAARDGAADEPLPINPRRALCTPPGLHWFDPAYPPLSVGHQITNANARELALAEALVAERQAHVLTALSRDEWKAMYHLQLDAAGTHAALHAAADLLITAAEERAESAQRELTKARTTNSQLNRRVQAAESAVARELPALKAQLADAERFGQERHQLVIRLRNERDGLRELAALEE